MAIGMAMEKGSAVVAYNEKNRELFRKNGKLHGYTAAGVTVINGNSLITYDDKGRETSRRGVR
jgi:hypothetical protein